MLIDLITTAQENCRLRTNVLPSDEGFNQAGFQENIPQELLKYLKQKYLSPVPLLPAMKEIQGNIDAVHSGNDLRDDEKAKRYFQLQNRYLAFKKQLNTIKNTTARNNQRCSRLNIKQQNSSTATQHSPFPLTPSK